MSNYKVKRHGLGNGRYLIKMTRGHDARKAEIIFMVTRKSLREELKHNQTDEFNLTSYSDEDIILFLDPPHWLLIEQQHVNMRITLSEKTMRRLIRKLEHIAPGLSAHVAKFTSSTSTQ